MYNLRAAPGGAKPKTNQNIASHGSQSCTTIGCVPVLTADHQKGFYECPLIEDSELPLLWGLRSIAEKRGVIDTYNKRIYLMGYGGYSMNCARGTRYFELETAPSGHLMLPITCYDRPKAEDQGGETTSKRDQAYPEMVPELEEEKGGGSKAAPPDNKF